MMRPQTIAICALGALLATTFSFGSAVQQSDPEIAALRKEVESLKAEVEDLRAFADGQDAAGAALINSLARCEAEGFTAGINPKSREILLEGLRTQAKAMQTAKDEDKKDDDKDGSRRGRRRGR